MSDAITNAPPAMPVQIQKSRTVAFLLLFFLGAFGIHRFYVGKVGTGVIYMLTLGLLGFGVLVDFVMILTGSFRTKNGEFIPW